MDITIHLSTANWTLANLALVVVGSMVVTAYLVLFPPE